MKLISDTLLSAFPNKILNIHPSLLPAYKGLNAQQQALSDSASITGCTVHIVTKEMDSGPILMQKTVDVKAGDTVESLSERILIEEHKLYPKAIKEFNERTPEWEH